MEFDNAIVNSLVGTAVGTASTGSALVWYVTRENKKRITALEKKVDGVLTVLKAEIERDLEKEIGHIKTYVDLKHTSVQDTLDEIKRKVDLTFERLHEIFQTLSNKQ